MVDFCLNVLVMRGPLNVDNISPAIVKDCVHSAKLFV